MDTKNKERKRTRSGILLQVTLGVIIVFSIATVLSWVTYLHSVDKIVEDSKEELITSEAELISSAFDYIAEFFTESLSESLSSPNAVSELLDAISAKKQTNLVIEANKIVKELAGSETMGINLFIVAMLASPPTIPESIVYLSSDDSLGFSDIPKAVEEILESGESYALLESGMAKWKLEDEHLMVIYDVGEKIYGGAVPVYAIGIKPMHNEITRIDDFYAKQKRNVNTIVSIVIACALLILTLLTFFWLRFLIRSKITKPIEELEDAAEKVMEGDLDVEVPVREGEEFTNLKKAFNGMLNSIRDIINRATGG